MLSTLAMQLWMTENPILAAALAGALLLTASLLLILEVIIVSAGVLGIMSLITASYACYIGFQVSPAVGWVCVVLTPICSIVSMRIGLNRLQHSSCIPHEEITADAGYHHTAERAGAHIGAIGTLVSDAMPTGKAQFSSAAHIIDVVVCGAAGTQGQSVRVLGIDGAVVSVALHASPHETSTTDAAAYLHPPQGS